MLLAISQCCNWASNSFISSPTAESALCFHVSLQSERARKLWWILKLAKRTKNERKEFRPIICESSCFPKSDSCSPTTFFLFFKQVIHFPQPTVSCFSNRCFILCKQMMYFLRAVDSVLNQSIRESWVLFNLSVLKYYREAFKRICGWRPLK